MVFSCALLTFLLPEVCLRPFAWSRFARQLFCERLQTMIIRFQRVVWHVSWRSHDGNFIFMGTQSPSNVITARAIHWLSLFLFFHIFPPCKEIKLLLHLKSMSCISGILWYFLLWLLHWCFKHNILLYKLWVRSETYPLFSLWYHRHLTSSQISQSEISKCKLMWTLSFLYLQRRGLKFTSDSCETRSLDRLPSLCVCVCVFTWVCVLYVLYDCVCLLCMFEGGWYSLRKSERGWPVECGG